MRVEDEYRSDLIDLKELKRIIDEAYAKAPPGTKVFFCGGDPVPEPIRAGLFATHMATCDGAYLLRLTDEEAEELNAEQAEDSHKCNWSKLDVPVFVLSPDKDEIA